MDKVEINDQFNKALKGEFCRYEVEVYGRVFQSTIIPTFDSIGKCIGAIGVRVSIVKVTYRNAWGKY